AVVGARSVLTRYGETRGDQRLLTDLLAPHERDQRLPALGREAETKSSGDLGLDPALAEIGTRPLTGGLPEGVDVGARGEIHRPEELLSARIGARPTLVGQRDPDALCQRADRLGERETILAHDETEGVAADSAAEAMEDVLLGVDGE